MQVDDIFRFYQSLSSQSDLRRLVKDKVREDLYLEFKEKSDRRDGKLSDDDKKNFSKSLSGFANSDGGVLVWGLERGKNETAKSLKPIEDLDEFIKSLKKILINVVQPFVDDVRIEPIYVSKKSSAGYVKCLIPRSDKTPHRAVLADREYYKRSTEGFYKLEHFDLEDMFGRRQRPLLNLSLSLNPIKGDDSQRELVFTFTNYGRAVAKHYGFLCRFSLNMEILSVTELSNVTHLNRIPTVSCEGNLGVIHPNNIAIRVGSLVYRVKHGERIAGQVIYYCENMQAKPLDFYIDDEQQVL